MRRKITNAALALLTLSFIACSQEEVVPQGEPQEITIRTRAADSGSATETFTGNFTLELWNDGTHTTHQMTYTEGTGWNTVKVNKLGTTINALAYCGNTVTVTSLDNYTVELTEDQSTETAFKAADVMIATGTVAADGSLSLNFEHHFAKVTFNANLASEFDEEDKIAALKVMTVDGKTINAHVDEKTVSAIITPGQYTAGNNFLSITVLGEDNPLTVKVPTDGLAFTAGTHYTFNLKVGKDKVTIEKASMENIDSPFGGGWNNENDLN